MLFPGHGAGRGMLPSLFCGLIGLLAITTRSQAQSFTNPGFESGTTGWTGIIETGTAPTYGGTGTGHVAEVDGNFSLSSTDDRILCQTVSGFTIGRQYALDFWATRRGTGTPPATVSVTVTIDGLALVAVVSRTGGYSMQKTRLMFYATQTTHTLTITPLFEGSYGMIFDDFVYTPATNLPVELVRFDAQGEDDQVHLEWATASESNNAYFEVQRSANNVDWRAVDVVPGAGESQQLLTYSSNDALPLDGLSYYRLEQVDQDGTASFSDVRSVFVRGADHAIRLWPVPASDRLFIQGIDPRTQQVDVVNELGSLVPVQRLPLENGILLDIAALPPGHYHVRTSDAHASGAFIKL